MAIALINQELPNGDYRTICLYNGGHPNHTGYYLQKYYSDEAMVSKLMDLGCLKNLWGTIESCNPIYENVATSYADKFTIYDYWVKSFHEFVDYHYFFENNMWVCIDKERLEVGIDDIVLRLERGY